MNALINAAVDHSRTVLMVLTLLLITGTVSYLSIPKEANPDIDIPIIYTHTGLEGISPEDAERMLVKPIEKELESIEGVKKLNSSAYEGGASVTLEFDAGFDADAALTEVREQVDKAKSNLPDEADDPIVEEVNLSEFPVLVVSLSGAVPERALYAIADRLQDAVEALPGVLEAPINGKREEMVEILIDPLVLESYGINEAELFNTVSRNNRLVAAGVLDSGAGRFPLKVPGVVENASELFSLPIKSVNGQVVRFEDISEIRRIYKDSDSFARMGGEAAVTLDIKKRVGENIIDTIDAVKAVVEEQSAFWPVGLTVNFYGDQSQDVRDMLLDLQNNVLSAVLLVVVVVIAALGLRTAGLVAVAIPGSFMIGILVLSTLGLTVNIVVLFSLIMSVGMLVDGAIVVTEFADRRMADKVPRREAYRQAAQRMAWPIIASTATTLAVFLPLLFWPGIVGQFMKYLPITLIATLSASLMMALIFVPTLGGLIGKPGPRSDAATANLVAAETGDMRELTGFTGRYVAFLAWAIRFPLQILFLVIALLIAIFTFYGEFGRGTEFFPEVEPKQANIAVLARGDLAVRERDQLLRKVEREVLKIPEFKTAYARTNVDGTDKIGTISVEFHDWDKRERRADVVLDDVRHLNEVIPGILIEVQKMGEGPGGDQKPIQVAFASNDNALASKAADRLHQWMLDEGGYVDIEDSLPLPGLEWNVRVDREEAGRFGADVALIGTFVQLITNGVKLSTYRPDDSDEELDIRARFPADKRQLSQLQDLRVAGANGYVPIGNFTTIEPSQKVSTLRRLDGQSVHRVKAAVTPREGEDVVNLGQLANQRLQEMKDAAEEFGIDPRVEVIFEGQDADQAEAQTFLGNAFGVALFIMAIILVTQFNSFYQAFLVLTAVILSVGGVLIGLMVTQQPFGIIMSGVGVISLAGIVVNNNIVLIDTFNVIRREGADVGIAVLRTGAQRLRPVLLTTVTTILGLMPMVLKMNIDLFGREISFGAPSTQWWSQLATAVAGGLAFATILTLVLTPCLLAMTGRYGPMFASAGRAVASAAGKRDKAPTQPAG
ncbi:MAG: efflux RND transporter permease subunit [Pseudomonadota bacterium]